MGTQTDILGPVLFEHGEGRFDELEGVGLLLAESLLRSGWHRETGAPGLVSVPDYACLSCELL